MNKISSYSSICLIGVGTIGGFLAKSISELETTKNLLIIDHDIVELKNTKNSIYTKNDIGKFKVDALYEKIKNNTNVTTINKKFIEGFTIIPKFDLVIDCRDFTYERKDLIDIRLYISYRNLVIDCRKNVIFNNKHEGAYIERLTKTELKTVILNFILLMENEILKELIKNKIIHEIAIDNVSEKTKKAIEQKSNDLVYDENNYDDNKLINLHKNYKEIIDINKNNNLTVCVGSKTSPFSSHEIPTNQIKTINDLISKFSECLETVPFQYNYYVISVNIYNNKYFIELLPETGAA